jgi:hypothetical protein
LTRIVPAFAARVGSHIATRQASTGWTVRNSGPSRRGRLRTLALRTAALFVVGALVAPAIAECAGWSSSAVGRHACCRDRGAMATETSMRACCGMSEQSSETAPPETQAARTPLKLFGPHVVPMAVSAFASRTLLPGESSSLRRASVVPLYLQQASLLI